MFDKEFPFRSLLDGASDTLAVLRAKDESAQDEQVKGALEKFEPFFFALGRH